MSGPSLPNAAFPVPPPVARQPIGEVREDGKVYFNQIGLQMFTLLWAGLQGNGGVKPQTDTNTQDVNTLFGMSGDATISSAGVITVTKTRGTPFGYFATGTNASNLTGTLNAAQMPALTGDATSTAGTVATTVGKLQGNPVANTAPSDGNVLTWVNADGKWEPKPPATGGTVTSVGTGTGLTGGPITGSGTISATLATAGAVGIVKPDGTTITVDGSGTISAVGGGGGSMLPLVNGDTPGPALIADPYGQCIGVPV